MLQRLGNGRFDKIMQLIVMTFPFNNRGFFCSLWWDFVLISDIFLHFLDGSCGPARLKNSRAIVKVKDEEGSRAAVWKVGFPAR